MEPRARERHGDAHPTVVTSAARGRSRTSCPARAASPGEPLLTSGHYACRVLDAALLRDPVLSGFVRRSVAGQHPRLPSRAEHLVGVPRSSIRHGSLPLKWSRDPMRATNLGGTARLIERQLVAESGGAPDDQELLAARRAPARAASGRRSMSGRTGAGTRPRRSTAASSSPAAGSSPAQPRSRQSLYHHWRLVDGGDAGDLHAAGCPIERGDDVCRDVVGPTRGGAGKGRGRKRDQAPAHCTAYASFLAPGPPLGQAVALGVVHIVDQLRLPVRRGARDPLLRSTRALVAPLLPEGVVERLLPPPPGGPSRTWGPAPFAWVRVHGSVKGARGERPRPRPRRPRCLPFHLSSVPWPDPSRLCPAPR